MGILARHVPSGDHNNFLILETPPLVNIWFGIWSEVMPSKLFELTAVLFGTGPVNFAWTPDCTVLASSGINKVVNITNRYGESVHRFSLTVSSNNNNNKHLLC